MCINVVFLVMYSVSCFGDGINTLPFYIVNHSVIGQSYQASSFISVLELGSANSRVLEFRVSL